MAKAKVAPKRKAANGYKLAEPLPLGEILTDISKKEWKLGSSIGQGGFGLIYSAKELASKGTTYPYAIKIEPHANGPLFVEMHFLMKNAKPEDVESFKKKKGLKSFGMPLLLGSGSHEYKGEKYRFIVMEKFGPDLWSIFLDNKKVFPTTTVFKIAVQILDVLEYIHSNGYIHADIKAGNILMGITKETQNRQCYLVDFGLASKWKDDTDFKPNPKRAHDGTIEYLSRDAHQGVQTRRGDLEVLAYNLIQWLGCVLPWEKKLTDPVTVQKSKEEHMSSIPKFMKTCFEQKTPPGPLLEFLKNISTLKHNTKPDYQKIRKILISGLDPADSLDKPFNFSLQNKRMPSKSPAKKTTVKRKSNDPSSSALKVKTVRKKEQLVSESSEDEKENLDDDDSDEETVSKSKKIVTPRGRPKKGKSAKEKPKKTAKKALVSESSEDDKENLDDDDSDEETVSNPKKIVTPKGRPRKGKSTQEKLKKTAKKELVSESSEDEKENLADDDNNEETGSKPKKLVTSRERPRKVKSTEDSDEAEEKPKKKTAKKHSATEKESPNLNGYTAAMKEILQRKMEKEKSKGKNKKVESNGMEGFTESMKEIALKQKERLARKGK